MPYDLSKFSHNAFRALKWRINDLVLQKKQNMKSSQLRKYLADLISGKSFGNSSTIAAIGQRMSEEKLLPVNKTPVTPLEAAKFIIYCAVLPKVGKGLANDLIKDYEAAWKVEPTWGDGEKRPFENTSLGYLTNVLAGKAKIPHKMYIDRMNGDIWTDDMVKGDLGEILVENFSHYKGIYANMYSGGILAKSTIQITPLWFEMLINGLSKQ